MNGGGGETRNNGIANIDPLSTDPTITSGSGKRRDDIVNLELDKVGSGHQITKRQKAVVTQSLQSTQHGRYKMSSPYKKNFNDQYYISQIAKRQ